MRRIVFDCDRCGRRDIEPVFSRFSREGQTDEHLLGLEERTALVEQVGYRYDDVGETVFRLLSSLEQLKGWVHFCDRCFGKIADNLAQIMVVQKAPMATPASPAEPQAPAEDAPLRKLKKVAAGG